MNLCIGFVVTAEQYWWIMSELALNGLLRDLYAQITTECTSSNDLCKEEASCCLSDSDEDEREDWSKVWHQLRAMNLLARDGDIASQEPSPLHEWHELQAPPKKQDNKLAGGLAWRGVKELNFSQRLKRDIVGRFLGEKRKTLFSAEHDVTKDSTWAVVGIALNHVALGPKCASYPIPRSLSPELKQASTSYSISIANRVAICWQVEQWVQQLQDLLLARLTTLSEHLTSAVQGWTADRSLLIWSYVSASSPSLVKDCVRRWKEDIQLIHVVSPKCACRY